MSSAVKKYKGDRERLSWLVRAYREGLMDIMQGKIPEIPLKVEIHPYHISQVKGCNNACGFCTRLDDKNELKNNKEVGIDPDRLMAFIQSLKGSGVKKILLSGNSTEPLLYPKIDEVIRTIKESGFDLDTYSNFYFGKRVYRAFMKYATKGDLIRISLNAGTNETYRKSHNPKDPNAFNLIVKNVEELIRLRKEHQSPLSIQIAYLLVHENSSEQELNKIISWADQAGVDNIRFSVPLKPTSQNDEFDLKEDEGKVMKARVNTIARKHQGHRLRIYVRQDEVNQPDKPFDRCCHGKMIPVLGTRGKIYPCTSVSIAGFDKLGIGDINSDDFDFWSIWKDTEKWQHDVSQCPDCTRFEFDFNVAMDDAIKNYHANSGDSEINSQQKKEIVYENFGAKEEAKIIAILGLGRWGGNVLLSTISNTFPDFAVYGFARSTYQQWKEKEDLNKNIEIYHTNDYRRLILNDDRIKMVVIATDASSHHEMVKEALVAGKDVFVEKPIAMTDEEAKELGALAKEDKKLLAVGYEFMFDPNINLLKKIIQDEAFGGSHAVEVNMLNPLAGRKLDMTSNVVEDLAPHMLSILQVIVGQREVKNLEANANESKEAVGIKFDYGNIRVGINIDRDYQGEKDRTIHVTGDKYKIVLNYQQGTFNMMDAEGHEKQPDDIDFYKKHLDTERDRRSPVALEFIAFLKSVGIPFLESKDMRELPINAAELTAWIPEVIDDVKDLLGFSSSPVMVVRLLEHL